MVQKSFFFLLLSLYLLTFAKKLHRIAREMAQSCTEKLQNRAESARSAAKNTEPVFFLIFINFFLRKRRNKAFATIAQLGVNVSKKNFFID